MSGSEAVHNSRAVQHVRASRRGSHEERGDRHGARLGFQNLRHEHARANPIADRGAVRAPQSLDLRLHGPAQGRLERSRSE